MNDGGIDAAASRNEGRLARTWAFVKAHAAPIAMGVGATAAVVAGIAMPASARKGIADGAKKLLLSGNGKRAAAAAVTTAATVATVSAAKPIERTFMGLTEAQLNEIAQSVYHGVSAVIDDLNCVIFKYKSNSGKTMMSARLWNELGGIGVDQGLANASNASSLPRIFAERVFEAASKAAE